MPPLVDSAFLVDGVGCGIRSGIGLRRIGSGVIGAIIACFGVADNDNSVIQASAAAIIDANDTRLVELEDAATGINCDSERVSPQLCLDIVDAGSNLSDVSDIADCLVSVMSTSRFRTGAARSVTIVGIKHDTLLFLEGPSSVHPAATAAPEAVVFAEHLLVALVVPQGAINKLLLREAHRRGVVLLSNCTLKC